MDFNVVAKDRQEFWKNIDEYYHKGNTAQVTYRRKALAKVIKNNNISSILELGCNSGGNLLYIVEECPDIKAVGLDINERAIAYGKEVEKNTADLRIGSIYDLGSFENKSFDLVFTCTCLLHIPHTKIEGIISEMNRVAKYYIINIERNGKDKVQSMSSTGVPHAFAHDYTSRYKKMGLNINIVDMPKITKYKKAQGGADHFMWANLTTDKKLKIDV